MVPDVLGCFGSDHEQIHLLLSSAVATFVDQYDAP